MNQPAVDPSIKLEMQKVYDTQTAQEEVLNRMLRKTYQTQQIAIESAEELARHEDILNEVDKNEDKIGNNLKRSNRKLTEIRRGIDCCVCNLL